MVVFDTFTIYNFRYLFTSKLRNLVNYLLQLIILISQVTLGVRSGEHLRLKNFQIGIWKTICNTHVMKQHSRCTQNTTHRTLQTHFGQNESKKASDAGNGLLDPPYLKTGEE